MLPVEVEWGWPRHERTPWHARRVGAERTLCGRLVSNSKTAPGYFPAAQPSNPQPRCAGCVEALAGLAPAGEGE